MAAMRSNPYESPGEVTDQPPQAWRPDARQCLYAFSAAVISGFYLAWAFPRTDAALPLPVHQTLFLCFAFGGIIAGPIFFLIALIRWLITK